MPYFLCVVGSPSSARLKIYEKEESNADNNNKGLVVVVVVVVDVCYSRVWNYVKLKV